MLRRPLKTHIIINLAALLVVAMALVEVIATAAMERLVVEEKKKAVALFLDTLRFSAMEIQGEDLGRMIRNLGPDCHLLVGTAGTLSQSEKNPAEVDRILRESARAALATVHTTSTFAGRTWGMFWPQPRYLVAAAGWVGPSPETRLAVAMAWDLRPTYQRMRQPQKAMLAYIFINTLILTLIGFYLLWSAVGRPISRLAKRAEEFRPEDTLFLTPDASDNEFDKLSRSLNSMLKRIGQDQEKLRTTVRSLEKANAELIQAQKDVIRAEKLASTGRLASGVAHEIGNPIGIVLGYLDLLRQSGNGASERMDFIDRAQKEIERINTIIRQLLDLSRPSTSRLVPVSVHRVIEDLLEVVQHQPALSAVRVFADLNARPDTVRASHDQLRQVFLNLILNASDAVHTAGAEPGTLHIRSELSEESVQTAPSRKSRQVVVHFSDNGTGMEEAMLGDIFDPFFTTKAPGKGTGLGLSVCFSIVERFGGSIFAQSAPGQGTTVSVHLPLYDEAEEGARTDEDCGEKVADS